MREERSLVGGKERDEKEKERGRRRSGESRVRPRGVNALSTLYRD